MLVFLSGVYQCPLANQPRTSCTPTSCPPLSVRHLAKLSRSHNTESREDTARANLPELWRERDFTDASCPRKVATTSVESVQRGKREGRERGERGEREGREREREGRERGERREREGRERGERGEREGREREERGEREGRERERR